MAGETPARPGCSVTGKDLCGAKHGDPERLVEADAYRRPLMRLPRGGETPIGRPATIPRRPGESPGKGKVTAKVRCHRLQPRQTRLRHGLDKEPELAERGLLW